MSFPRPMTAPMTSGTWQTILSVSNSTNDTLAAGYTGRLYFANGVLTTSVTGGSQIRVTFAAGASNWAITKAYIGHRSGTIDFVTTPVQLLFGGSASTTVTAGSTTVSDGASFAWDTTKGLVISVYNSSGGHSWKRGAALTSCGDYYKGPVDDAATVTTSGYTSDQVNQAVGINKIEVFA